MKRMLIDDTQPEETRVVILDGTKVEDVEFESTAKKQIKGNVFSARVVRIEPSLQAAFVDYGGNRHGFLAFGEIHPDYYNISDEVRAEAEAEADAIIEKKRQYQAERKAEEARRRAEREQRRAEYLARQAEEAAQAENAEADETNAEETDGEGTHTACQCGPECACRQEDGECHCAERGECTCDETCACHEDEAEACACGEECPCHDAEVSEEAESETAEEPTEEVSEDEEKSKRRPRRRTNRFLGRRNNRKGNFKVSNEDSGLEAVEVSEDVTEEEEDLSAYEEDAKAYSQADEEEENEAGTQDFDDEDEDFEHYLEVQRKLIVARKLYHRSTIQDVIKEGQVLLIQIVKEERGNKGAACTTYLSLAGRYCVLMPNRIKSGGVSRKITSAADRKRLKEILRELPINDTMSLIVRTAGEDKQKEDIVRDYNYLIRSWNHIRHAALSTPAPALIYEEGNLIKRALRDMCTKDIDEVIIDGDGAYQTAKMFSKILSPNLSRKIKCHKASEAPLFQQYQVEKELDKLHNPVVQLQSGGYLVINPTEALVSIDVNSGRATHEKDIEETALKTNLEAADEIAKQLRMRNLAGLVVVDFIDMEEAANNHAVERRMKEAMKSDRARVQIAKMSIFGLLEISRQRMHSSFVESNYVVCPYCRGQGVMRTTESSGVLVLRALEEEGIKGAFNRLEVKLPTDIALYLLNHKRRNVADLEEKYGLQIIISADGSLKNVSDMRIEKSRLPKVRTENKAPVFEYEPDAADEPEVEETPAEETSAEEETPANSSRRNRYDRRRRNRRFNRRERYNRPEETPAPQEEEPKKKAWWKKLLG
jgi:ribonuclease E